MFSVETITSVGRGGKVGGGNPHEKMAAYYGERRRPWKGLSCDIKIQFSIEMMKRQVGCERRVKRGAERCLVHAVRRWRSHQRWWVLERRH